MSTDTGLTLSACLSCVQHFANGECGDCHNDPYREFRPHDHGATPCPTGVRINRMLDDYPGAWVACGCSCCDTEDREPWFSWSSCEVCGTALGGDREHVTLFVPDAPDRTVTRTTRDGHTLTVRPSGVDGCQQLYVSLTLSSGEPVTRYRTAVLGAWDGRDRYRALAEWYRAQLTR